MDRISVSQIKTFIKSKAERAGKYLLNIREDKQEDYFIMGHVFEAWIMFWKDISDKYLKEIKNKKTFFEEFETLKYNSEWLEFIRGKNNYEVKGKLFWQDILWYIDSYTKDEIIDIKTTQYLSKDDWKKWLFGMNSYDSYKLQLWIYFRLTWVKKTKIIEVSKHRYKNKERHEHQIIEFNWTKEEDLKMEKKYKPIIEEMNEMFNKFNKK